MIVDGIRCAKCGSEKTVMMLYGMPAFDEELMREALDGQLNRL